MKVPGCFFSLVSSCLSLLTEHAVEQLSLRSLVQTSCNSLLSPGTASTRSHSVALSTPPLSGSSRGRAQYHSPQPRDPSIVNVGGKVKISRVSLSSCTVPTWSVPCPIFRQFPQMSDQRSGCHPGI